MNVHGKVEFTKDEALEIVALESKMYLLRQKIEKKIEDLSELMHKPVFVFVKDPEKDPVNIRVKEILENIKVLHKEGAALEDKKEHLKKTGHLPANW